MNHTGRHLVNRAGVFLTSPKRKRGDPLASTSGWWDSLPAVAAAALLVLSAGCNRQPAASEKSEPTGKPAAEPGVQLVRPERKTVRHVIEQPGFNIEAFQETALYPKIQGYVLRWNVDIGDSVKGPRSDRAVAAAGAVAVAVDMREAVRDSRFDGKDRLVKEGDVLAELYVPEMVVDVQRKEAAVRQAMAQALQAKAAVSTAKAQLEQKKSQYERFERLGRTQGLVSQENIDETRYGYHAAQAGLEKAEADVALAAAMLGVAQEDRDFTKTMLEYRLVRAPFDGVVTKKNVNTNDFVQSTGIRGQPLFVVVQLDPVRVFVNVAEADAPWIKNGDPVTLTLNGAGGERIQGKVTRNARALDPRSRTLRTEIDLPNPGHKLLPGMYVQATFTVEHPNVWTLPAAAVRTEGSQAFCYRVVNGKAVRTPVQIGLRGGGLIQILKIQMASSAAQKAGPWIVPTGQEEIVRDNEGTLKDGQPVISPSSSAGRPRG